MPSPFPPLWISFDLGDYRPCDDTYGAFSFETLPPLDARELDTLFQSLRAPSAKPDPDARQRVAALELAVKRVGRHLPASFIDLMSRPDVHESIPSCTACEWALGKAPIANTAEPGAYTVRFLRDQQDVFLWYLYLAPERAPEVICSRIPFDDPEVIADPRVTQDVVIDNTCLAAPSFESFVYRYWIENELWDLVQRPDAELTPAQRAYLYHYRREALLR